MKFEELDIFDKFKVWFDYKINFICLKLIDGYEFNHMGFKEFCEHKFFFGTGEAQRWLDCYEDRIFNT